MPKVEKQKIDRSANPFMPQFSQGNSDLIEFLKPFDYNLNWLKDEADALPTLIRPDKCPRKFLPLHAANLGFELPDHRFCTEEIQRKLLAAVPYIYFYRGHINCIKKFMEILGFSYQGHHEEVGDALRANAGRSYDYDVRIFYINVDDDFNDGDITNWAKTRSGSAWIPVNGRLEGTGDGSDNWDNNCLHEFNIATHYIKTCYSVDFEVLGGSGTKFPNFGITMFDYLHSFGIQYGFRTEGGTSYLDSWLLAYGSPFLYDSIDLTGFPVDYTTGVHTLRIFETGDNVTIGLDDETIVLNWVHPQSSLKNAGAHPGLFCNQSTNVAWDNFRYDRIGVLVPNKTFSGNQFAKHITIIYSWSGDEAEHDKWIEYLNLILPAYVPVGVQIIWERI